MSWVSGGWTSSIEAAESSRRPDPGEAAPTCPSVASVSRAAVLVRRGCGTAATPGGNAGDGYSRRVLLTISAGRSPALATPSDLGFFLHKHPDRAQRFDVYGGTAHVFYPEVSAARCTAALLLEVDPVALVRGRSGSGDGFALGQYVNDRPYVASSLLSVAMGKVFRSALGGRCRGHEELVDAALELTVTAPVVPGRPELVERLFSPLGWQVTASAIPADPTRPEWGPAPLAAVTLSGSMRLADALTHLYVLLPVLDDTKHYWVGEAEVDKLLRAGAGWLPAHPERELITRRYLAHQKDLAEAAATRLAELDDRLVVEPPVADETAPARPLVRLRQDAVLDLVRELAPTSVADLGCGSGALLAGLLRTPGIARVIGTDVSDALLARAATRLHVDRMTERQSERLELLLSSLLYVDDRLADMDLAILMEVVEHIDPDRLPAVVDNVFGAMRPRHVVVTTPNVEYNALYPGLVDGGLRHPDHRFEWTRDQFARWAADVGAAHGYQVELREIGKTDPDLGAPTQMAVFGRHEETEGTA